MSHFQPNRCLILISGSLIFKESLSKAARAHKALFAFSVTAIIVFRRAKPGRIGSLAFAMKNRHFGGHCSWILAGKAGKCGRFWVFTCVPNPGKQSIWRQCPPSARLQSTKKLPNRPGFTHVQVNLRFCQTFAGEKQAKRGSNLLIKRGEGLQGLKPSLIFSFDLRWGGFLCLRCCLDQLLFFGAPPDLCFPACVFSRTRNEIQKIGSFMSFLFTGLLLEGKELGP